MNTVAKKLYDKQWRIANPHKLVEYEAKRRQKDRAKRRIASKLFRLRHPDRVRESNRMQRLKNPENRLRLQRLWCSKNPEKLKEQGRKHRLNNAEKERLRLKSWRRKNPEKRKNQNFRRRCLTVGQVNCSNKILQLNNVHKCYWCSEELNESNRTVDHVTPLSRGGNNIPENLVACCRTCNSSKSSKLYWEWDEELAA